jgi:hypothetical protein
MAQKVTVALEDDLDGGPADGTVRFAIGGAHYEIDLSASNAAAFRRRLAAFIAHARKAGRGPRPPARAKCGKPGAQRRYPGVGETGGHRGQRARAHPRQRR